MFSPLRNRFGIPGVIAVIALVFAMLGGAYAATDGLGGKAKISAKAKKGPRGPKGPAGPAGPAGAQGSAGQNGKDGLNGLDGEDGEDGDDGSDGTNGEDGTSIANTTEPAGANCTAGGTKLVGTSTTYACNGAKGADGEDGAAGPEGSPWTLGGVLPPEKSLTGAWSFGALPEGFKFTNPLAERVYSPISFPIPLKDEIALANVHYIKQSETPPTGCTGGTPAQPKADPGHLCVYTQAQSGVETKYNTIAILKASAGTGGASRSGAVLSVSPLPQTEPVVDMGGAFARGTWAVTAPPPTP